MPATRFWDGSQWREVTDELHRAQAADAHQGTAVSYDNATSGLTADQVQAAIDELRANHGGDMNWAGGWVQDTTYQTGDVVRDGEWLMIANKTTTDRPAPQPTGSAFWVSGFDDTPTWTNSTTASHDQVIAGNRYALSTVGYLSGLRVWVPAADPGLSYSIVLVEDPEGASPIFDNLITFTPATPGWKTVDVPQLIVGSGFQFDVLLIASSTQGGTNWNADWNYATTNGDPVSGQITHQNSNHGEMRIHHTAAVGGDQETNLDNLTVGDTIAAAGNTWTITQVTLGATFNTYIVNPASRGVAGAYTFTFTNYTPADITWVDEPDHWLADPDVDGLLAKDADWSSIVPDDHMYGTDVEYQQATISADWDLLAVSGGGGGGGGGGSTTYAALTDTDVTDLTNGVGGQVPIFDETGILRTSGETSPRSGSFTLTNADSDLILIVDDGAVVTVPVGLTRHRYQFLNSTGGGFSIQPDPGVTISSPNGNSAQTAFTLRYLSADTYVGLADSEITSVDAVDVTYDPANADNLTDTNVQAALDTIAGSPPTVGGGFTMANFETVAPGGLISTDYTPTWDHTNTTDGAGWTFLQVFDGGTAGGDNRVLSSAQSTGGQRRSVELWQQNTNAVFAQFNTGTGGIADTSGPRPTFPAGTRRVLVYRMRGNGTNVVMQSMMQIDGSPLAPSAGVNIDAAGGSGTEGQLVLGSRAGDSPAHQPIWHGQAYVFERGLTDAEVGELGQFLFDQEDGVTSEPAWVAADPALAFRMDPTTNPPLDTSGNGVVFSVGAGATWTPQTGGGGSTPGDQSSLKLTKLGDVDVDASPTDGNVPTWDDTDGEFKWATPSGGGGSDPITTEGDLIVGDAAGDSIRLPIGTSGHVLKSTGSTAQWAAESGGGGSGHGDIRHVYVDPNNGSDGNNGLSWATAKQTLAGAIGPTPQPSAPWVVGFGTRLVLRAGHYTVDDTIIVADSGTIVGERISTGQSGDPLNVYGTVLHQGTGLSTTDPVIRIFNWGNAGQPVTQGGIFDIGIAGQGTGGAAKFCSGGLRRGDWDPTSGIYPGGNLTGQDGDVWRCSGTGVFGGETWAVGDQLEAAVDQPGTGEGSNADWNRYPYRTNDGIQTGDGAGVNCTIGDAFYVDGVRVSGMPRHGFNIDGQDNNNACNPMAWGSIEGFGNGLNSDGDGALFRIRRLVSGNAVLRSIQGDNNRGGLVRVENGDDAGGLTVGQLKSERDVSAGDGGGHANIVEFINSGGTGFQVDTFYNLNLADTVAPVAADQAGAVFKATGGAPQITCHSYLHHEAVGSTDQYPNFYDDGTLVLPASDYKTNGRGILINAEQTVDSVHVLEGHTPPEITAYSGIYSPAKGQLLAKDSDGTTYDLLGGGSHITSTQLALASVGTHNAAHGGDEHMLLDTILGTAAFTIAFPTRAQIDAANGTAGLTFGGGLLASWSMEPSDGSQVYGWAPLLPLMTLVTGQSDNIAHGVFLHSTPVRVDAYPFGTGNWYSIITPGKVI